MARTACVLVALGEHGRAAELISQALYATALAADGNRAHVAELLDRMTVDNVLSPRQPSVVLVQMAALAGDSARVPVPPTLSRGPGRPRWP